MSENVNHTIEEVLENAKKSNRRADLKLIRRAYDFAKSKHGEQLRRSGEPYIIHPVQVAYILSTLGLDESTICAALLHDVIEDTDVTEDYLLKIGLSKRIVDAVIALTRSEDIDYQEYIKNLGSNPLAKEVKLADLEHNMDLKRLPTLEEKDLERNRKYQIAYHYLINNK